MARFDSTGLIVLLFFSRLVQGAGGATTGVVQADVLHDVAVAIPLPSQYG